MIEYFIPKKLYKDNIGIIKKNWIIYRYSIRSSNWKIVYLWYKYIFSDLRDIFAIIYSIIENKTEYSLISNIEESE